MVTFVLTFEIGSREVESQMSNLGFIFVALFPPSTPSQRTQEGRSDLGWGRSCKFELEILTMIKQLQML